MRVWGGIEITPEFLDDLVDEWHENEETFPTSLSGFVIANTGFTPSEYEEWVMTGRIPPTEQEF